METPRESPCIRCPAALGRSCCEVREDERLATLTLQDTERISDFLRRPAERFAEWEWLSREDAVEYEERRPLYRGYFKHAPRRLTLRSKAEACVFLKKDSGCSLPSDVRPLACRLYPFEVGEGGRIGLQVPYFGSLEEARRSNDAPCLAVEERRGVEGLLAAFNFDRQQLRTLAAQIRQEVLVHSEWAGGSSLGG